MKKQVEIRGHNTITTITDSEGRVRFEMSGMVGYPTVCKSYDEHGSLIACGYCSPMAKEK